MQTHNITSPIVVLASILALAGTALADVPPPDACTTVGEACDNAGPNADEPGKCQASTCTRATPTGPQSYDCNLCALDSSSGGADSSGDSTTSSKKEDKGGCSVAMPSARVGHTSALLGLALAAVTLWRRR